MLNIVITRISLFGNNSLENLIWVCRSMCRPDLGLFLYICLNMFALMYLHSCLLIGYGKLKLILICFYIYIYANF